MLDETGTVAGPAAHYAQPVLQRRKWTDPTRRLDERPPKGGRHVKPGQPPPPEDQQASQHHEENESKVDRHHHVGKHEIEHLSFPDTT